MGLLLNILAFPLLGPIKGLKAIGEQVVNQVKAEQMSEKTFLRRLSELELLRDAGGIEDAPFRQQERKLLEDLADSRRRAA